MDFEFTDEQLKLKQKVKNFVDEEVIPKIAEYESFNRTYHVRTPGV